MTRRLLILITSLCIAGCSEKITGTDTPPGKGEYEKSYISVTLKSDDASTRADGLEEGEAEERYVENAHFFLFKSDGSAFPVNPAENRNYITFDFSANGTEPGTDPNISDVKDKILVFNSYKGEYPAYIVAVLNWDERHTCQRELYERVTAYVRQTYNKALRNRKKNMTLTSATTSTFVSPIM